MPVTLAERGSPAPLVRSALYQGFVKFPSFPNGNTFSPAMQIHTFNESHRQSVISLWRSCGLVMPWNNPDRDIDRKLSVDPERFLLGFVDDQLVSTILVGYDGHRGWINYLAVSPDYRNQGFGRQLVEEAERMLAEKGCPKINLQVRSSNQSVIDFYRRIGYAEDDVVSLGRRLIDD